MSLYTDYRNSRESFNLLVERQLLRGVRWRQMNSRSLLSTRTVLTIRRFRLERFIKYGLTILRV
jgi:hypothetical protein